MRDRIAEPDPLRLRMPEGLGRGVGRDDAGAQGRAAAGRLGETGERRQIDLAALGMKIEQALRQLGHLGDAARDGDPRHRMGAGNI